MQYRRIKAGTTDVSVILRVVDSTDGTPETGVAYNTTGIDLQYRREGAASTAITEATQTDSGAHSDGGFVHLGNGYCRLDLPDAACASGVSGVLVHGTITGMIVIGAYIDLEANDNADVYGRLGAPAGASVSADVAAVKAETATIVADTAELQTDLVNGGRLDLLIDGIKAKTDSLTFTVANQVDANVQYINDAAVTGDGNATPWDGA